MLESNYLCETSILDYKAPGIQQLIAKHGWSLLDDYDRIGAAYQFVKDEIAFGYNAGDNIPASQVLADGYGQCNTKGSLLMALLRALQIPCRFHGFTIEQSLQKGAIPTWLMPLAPKYIIHSWVEVWFEQRWINLEGFILDQAYLSAVQQKFLDQQGSFCGFGVADDCLASPCVNWVGKDTYIQRNGIHDDFGIFDDPDSFYAKHGTNLRGIKRWLYVYCMRHVINANVRRIRKQQ